MKLFLGVDGGQSGTTAVIGAGSCNHAATSAANPPVRRRTESKGAALVQWR